MESDWYIEGTSETGTGWWDELLPGQDMDYVLEAVQLVWDRRAEITGMRIVEAPNFLRHFTAHFERLTG